MYNYIREKSKLVTIYPCNRTLQFTIYGNTYWTVEENVYFQSSLRLLPKSNNNMFIQKVKRDASQFGPKKSILFS